MTGCGGGTHASSAGGAGSAPLPPAAGVALRGAEIGGQYAGTTTYHGQKDKLTANLAPSGTTYGGSVVITFATTTRHGAIVMQGAPTDLHGTLILPLVNPCSYAVNLRYKATAGTLSGTYTASGTCAVPSGTLTIKEQCFYKPATLEALDRPAGIGIKPC